MLIKILVVLSDGRVITCTDTEERDVLDNMLVMMDRFDNLVTNTVWISRDGFTTLKTRQETIKWIREEY